LTCSESHSSSPNNFTGLICRFFIRQKEGTAYVSKPVKKARRTRAQETSRPTNVARKGAKTKRKQGRALGEGPRKGPEARRKKATSDHPPSFDSELFALLRDTRGTNLEAISRLTGFTAERVSKLEEMGVVERSSEGGFRISEGFMGEFRRENLRRKTKRMEELEMREYLMESEARHDVQKEQPAGVA
jgi:hypothetical protein